MPSPSKVIVRHPVLVHAYLPVEHHILQDSECCLDLVPLQLFDHIGTLKKTCKKINLLVCFETFRKDDVSLWPKIVAEGFVLL